MLLSFRNCASIGCVIELSQLQLNRK
uniref:Uncharacterized protein n=1 Tax=Arundo donax TaxID=35708 RepID=A0A0A9GFP7_ARUDO